MPRSFTARYKGSCENDCGSPINVGDTVIYMYGELMHNACSQTIDDDEPVNACQSCWLVGPCDCDD